LTDEGARHYNRIRGHAGLEELASGGVVYVREASKDCGDSSSVRQGPGQSDMYAGSQEQRKKDSKNLARGPPRRYHQAGLAGHGSQ
jgi:hypothetical protein